MGDFSDVRIFPTNCKNTATTGEDRPTVTEAKEGET